MIKLRAHNCDIVICSKQTEEAFINENHYQGFRPSKECYALKDENGQIVEMMTFCKPRYNKSYKWELLRLCTKKDYQVPGGASKLLAAFIENHPNESIVSYCNESKFRGKVYEALGFKKISTCSSYHYEKDGKTYHRSSFQRWKLEQLFPQYNRKDYTERQIMELEGFKRVEEIQATWVLGEPNDKWYIYKISLENGAEYIGQHRYHETSNDSYSGSGKILKAMQKKYKWTKEVLIDNIDNQKDADKYERCAITMSRLSSNNINICNGGHGYIGNGVRGEWDREIREKISSSLKKYFAENESSHKGTKLSNVQKELISKTVTKRWKEGVYSAEHLQTLENRKKQRESLKKSNAKLTAEERKAKYGHSKLAEATEFIHKNGFKTKADIGSSWYYKLQNGKIKKIGEYLNVAFFMECE